MSSAAGTTTTTEVLYSVPTVDERWLLEETDVPESALHDAIILLIVEILRAWRTREDRDALVGRNIALRWVESKPKVGVDPDVYVVEPAPPEGEETKSICTWRAGHSAPRLAVEVVSESSADKDYLDGPDRYAASGTGELWVFDPLLAGPAIHGGPWRLQIWVRDEAGRFRRAYTGDGPARSDELAAWVVVTDGGRRLRIADDRDGRAVWPTEAEAERQAKDDALAEVARLEAELARLRGD